MEKRNVKWGNIIILLLIIVAAVYAFQNAKNTGSSPNQVQVSNSETGIATDNVVTVYEEKLIDDTMPGPDEFVMGLDSWIGGTPSLMA